MSLEKSSSSSEVLLRMMTGYWVAQALYVACKLGIADLIKDGGSSCRELAEATGVHERSLYRLMRALASVGAFAEAEKGVFELTPLATLLRGDVEGSMRGAAVMYGEEFYRAWAAFPSTIQTGEPCWDHVFGMGLFDYLEANPEVSEVFNRGMTDLGRTIYSDRGIVAAYDFSDLTKVVDIGGGHGSFLATVLSSNRALQGVLFDRPHVIEEARKGFSQNPELTARCEFVGGDFFESVPEGGHAYVLKRVIHDWEDGSAIAILRNCCEGMTPNGRVLVVEILIPPGNTRSFGKLLDINMMAVTGGLERTEEEYRDLFDRAGLSLTRVTHTECALSIIEGRASER